MAFSSDVKKELAGIVPQNRHCAAAEAAAFWQMLGDFDQEGRFLGIHTESADLIRKVFTLTKKAFNILVDFIPTDRIRYTLFEMASEDQKIILDAMANERKLLQKECCRRAYLRGAFLAVGTVINPEKHYRLEFVCKEPENANLLWKVMYSLDIEPRITERDGDFVVYIQEAEVISHVLGLLGANIAVLEFENIRVTREVRGNIQRRVNCETSNLNKTVTAAVRQIEAIELIIRNVGLDELPPALADMAVLRIENPEASLTELGNLMDPPLGRSGVNKRLKKLVDMAEEIKD